jgi:hypothetical protein
VLSASPHTKTGRLLALCLCCASLAGALAGCSTTQERATRERAEAAKFLKEREAKRAAKKADKSKKENHG